VSAQQRAQFDGSVDVNVQADVSGQHPTSCSIRPGSWTQERSCPDPLGSGISHLPAASSTRRTATMPPC